MNPPQTTRQIRALGLCSGGLDSMLAALVLRDQGIDVTFITFETPFFDAGNARKAARQTGIPLIVKEITGAYMEMMRSPKAGFGKNMNPCMDCHALMFSKAGEVMKAKGFDFLFSGEVVGQRPKSQTQNALRYVEKNSGMEGRMLRPLSARLLPETLVEQQGLVDRERLLDISGRSRKVQMALAATFGIREYPSPAGGCLLTDPGFSRRLRDLLYLQKTEDPSQLHLLKYGRHFRLDQETKLVVGRSQADNEKILALHDSKTQIRLRLADLPGPDALLSATRDQALILLAARITAGYTKSPPNTLARVQIHEAEGVRVLDVLTPEPGSFQDLLI